MAAIPLVVIKQDAKRRRTASATGFGALAIVPMKIAGAASAAKAGPAAESVLHARSKTSHMIYKRFTILFLLPLCFSLSHAQPKKSSDAKPAPNQQAEKKKREKEQAATLLKDNLLGAKSIGNTAQRANLIAEAAAALWGHDEPFARNSLSSALNDGFFEYESLFNKADKSQEEEAKLKEWAYYLKTLIKAFTKHDQQAANKFSQKLFKIRDANSSSLSLSERLKLASEGLDIDPAQTAAIVAQMLPRGIPSQFPQFISNLRKKDPAIAENLLRQAISQLAANPNYQSLDAVFLSTSAFNENGVLAPSIKNGEPPDNFFIFTSGVGPLERPFGKQVSLSYLAAARSFFSSRLNTPSSNFFSLRNIIASYFLIRKLGLYDRNLGAGDASFWANAETEVANLGRNLGMADASFASLAGYAERMAASADPLGLQDTDGMLERAENTKDPREKMRLKIAAVIRLIENRKFADADAQLSKIEIPEIQNPLRLFLNTRLSLAAIEERKWDNFEAGIKNISEKDIRAFLYQKALFSLKNNSDKELIQNYLFEARKNMDGIEARPSKASAYTSLASWLFDTNPGDGKLAVYDALKHINDNPEYDEGAFEIRLSIPGGDTFFAERIGDGSFRNMFSKLAKADFNEAQLHSIQLRSPGLKAIAQVAAAGAILR